MVLGKDDFEIVPNVAVVDEFSDHRVDLNSGFLENLVKTANANQLETGDMPPVIVGHNPDDPNVPEDQKPKVVGFARNFRIQPLGNTGRRAAFADLWVYKDRASAIKDFPRRSAEIHLATRTLDAVALLGPTAPHRKLGLPLKLSREVSMEPDKDTSELNKKLGDMMALLQQILEKIGPSASAPAGSADEDAELEALLAQMGAGENEEPEPESKKPDDETVKMQRRFAELEAKVAAGEIREHLLKLQAEGITVDVEAELKDLLPLDPATRKLMLSRIEKNYPKAPVGKAPLPGITDSKKVELNDETRKKILQLARTKSVSYEVAFSEVTGQSLETYHKGGN